MEFTLNKREREMKKHVKDSDAGTGRVVLGLSERLARGLHGKCMNEQQEAVTYAWDRGCCFLASGTLSHTSS